MSHEIKRDQQVLVVLHDQTGNYSDTRYDAVQGLTLSQIERDTKYTLMVRGSRVGGNVYWKRD